MTNPYDSSCCTSVIFDLEYNVYPVLYVIDLLVGMEQFLDPMLGFLQLGCHQIPVYILLVRSTKYILHLVFLFFAELVESLFVMFQRR